MKRYYKKLCIMLILSFIINFFSDAGEIVDLHALAAGTITVDCPTCSGKGTIPCPNIGVYDKAYFTKLPNYFACWTCAKSGHIEDTEHQTLCYRCSSGNQTVPQVTCPDCKGVPFLMKNCPNPDCYNGKVNGICDICGKVAKPDGSSNNYVGTWKDCPICGGAGMVCGWECNFCHKIADTMQNFTRDHVHVDIDCPDCEEGKIEITPTPTPKPSIYTLTVIDVYDGTQVTRSKETLTAGKSFTKLPKPNYNGVTYVYDTTMVVTSWNKMMVSANQNTGEVSCSSIQANTTLYYYYNKPECTLTIIDVFDGTEVTRSSQTLSAGESFSASKNSTYNGIEYNFTKVVASSDGNKTTVNVNSTTGEVSRSVILSNTTIKYYYKASSFSVTVINVYGGTRVTRTEKTLTSGKSFSTTKKTSYNGEFYNFNSVDATSVGNKTTINVNSSTGDVSIASIQSNVTIIYYYSKKADVQEGASPTPLPTEIPDAENELRVTPTPIALVTAPPTPTVKPIAKDPTPTPPQTVQNIIGSVKLPTPIVLPQKPMPTPAPIYVPAHKTQTVDRTENTAEPTFATSSTDHCDACFEEETDIHVHSTGAHENYATARAAAQPR